jgi:hypothetical protein
LARHHWWIRIFMPLEPYLEVAGKPSIIYAVHQADCSFFFDIPGMRVYFNTLVLNSKCFWFFQIIVLRSGFFFCSHITMDVHVVLFGFDCDYRRSGCVNPVPGFPICISGSCFQSVKFSKPNDGCKTFSSSFVESFT